MVRFFIFKFIPVIKQVRLVIFGLFGVCSGLLSAQSLPDSLALKLRNDSLRIYRQTTAKLFLKAENRFSFVSNENINLIGVMAGATFYERHTAFAGYFFLDPRNTDPISPEGWNDNIQHFLGMRYGVLGYQYVVLKTRFWQLNTPIAVGYGQYAVERRNLTGNEISSVQGNIIPTSAGLQLIFKPLHWIGVSASGGYRYIGEQQNTNLRLRGFYYAFGIWLDGRFLSRKFQYTQKKRHYQKIMAWRD